ncbi:cycloartenol synthase-like [Pyrus ussuriensis x Pyrus communis]|uniref:Cycloartenol synthase-like n=1 Tax=Pyrus ussuriensis x Pyrus communis TaxID=2448454 RepID=A0A5N5G1W4_9ROSA|nr:cycloartenol synthase-like [Pyrus ussuriensis x Pyrus communis]
MYLLPGLIITLSITGALNAVLSKEHQREMCRHLYNHQNEEGGWGLHIEGPSTMFGTALNNVTLRLLGEGTDDGQGAIELARKWILDHGGVTAITSWGKMWLSVLGAYEWSGNNPLPPEIFMCGYVLTLFHFIQVSVHNRRMWCHCQMVYLPMSYLYGKRFVGPITPTIRSLRKQLYTVPYHEVDWNNARNLYAKVYEPVFTRWPAKELRESALKTVMQHIHYEDENTRYLCIGPVNKLLNMLCCWTEDPNSEAFKLHLPRIPDIMDPWDTSFAIQAIISTNLVQEYGPTLRKAHQYIKDSQVLEDCPRDLNIWYRHISKGAWPFSTTDHGWPISDCTAEGLKRFYDAVNVTLSLQNDDCGFVTYELTRSYQWLELINPADMMLSCQTVRHIYDWYGSWGVCFTYAGWFGIKGLVAAGRTYENRYSICKACDLLLSKKLPSGGWGESYLSCQNKVYTNLKDNRPYIVHNAWAMLALIGAGQERIPVPLTTETDSKNFLDYFKRRLCNLFLRDFALCPALAHWVYHCQVFVS